MARKTNSKTQNSSVPPKPETPAEESAKEAVQAASAAAPQAETGNTPPSGTEAVPPSGGATQETAAYEADLAPELPGAAVEPTVTHIVVAARIPGFRRAGRAWSRESTAVPIEEFTDEQVKALANEPMLAVLFQTE